MWLKNGKKVTTTLIQVFSNIEIYYNNNYMKYILISYKLIYLIS